MPPQKPQERPHTESGTWTINKIRIGKFVLNPMTWLIICIGSWTPFGQWSLSKAGVTGLNGNIEAIKIATEANKSQIERLDAKVSALIVEVENLRMQRSRTAGQ